MDQILKKITRYQISQLQPVEKPETELRMTKFNQVLEKKLVGCVNGFSPGRYQVIIWPNDGILLIGPFGINFFDISVDILTFSFNKMRWNCRLRNSRHFVSA